MFENSLLESSGRRPSRRWFSLPLSILIHAGLIGSALAASAWYVEDVDEPPGARPPGARRAATSQAAQPSAAPASLPATVSAEPSEGDGPAIPGTIPGDDGPGGGEGIGAPRATSAPPADPPVIYRLDGDGKVSEPVEVSRVQPDYPDSARKARLQGTVVLEAVISRTGTVESVRVLRSVNPLLDASAAKAVTRWRYEPARFDGRPVPVYLTVTVRFQLE